jgi:hypothetical protein
LIQSSHGIIFCSLVVVLIVIISSNNVFGLPAPTANSTINTKLTDTLKSIMSNVSTNIQADLDKILSDTMDIQIKNALEQLNNATILGNNNQSGPKFLTKVPSGIDVFDGDGYLSSKRHHE